MGDLRDIKESIKRIGGSDGGTLVLAVQVTSVGDFECTVMFGEMKLTNVHYFTHPTKAGNLVIKPKIGSMATVLCDAAMRDLQLIEADTVESIKFEENGLVIEFDSLTGKVDIKNNTTSLKSLFQNLTNLIKQITVATPSGPSTTLITPTAIQLTNFETSFKQLLK